MDPNKHLYIAYSENSYDIINGSYYPMSQELLDAIKQDKRVSDSLIFDMNRQTIYAQGKEFGGLNAVFPKVTEGTEMDEQYAINILRKNPKFISGITQDQYGKISYTYSFAYLNLDVMHGTGIEFSPTYMASMFVNNEGKLTYKYAEVNHTTQEGRLAASIYNYLNGSINELIVDDPRSITLGPTTACVIESEGGLQKASGVVANIYSLETGYIIRENVFDSVDNLQRKFIKCLDNDLEYILWDSTEVLHIVFNDNSFSNYTINVITAGGLTVGTYCDNNVLLIRKSKGAPGLYVLNRKKHNYEYVGVLSVGSMSITPTITERSIIYYDNGKIPALKAMAFDYNDPVIGGKTVNLTEKITISHYTANKSGLYAVYTSVFKTSYTITVLNTTTKETVFSESYDEPSSGTERVLCSESCSTIAIKFANNSLTVFTHVLNRPKDETNYSFTIYGVQTVILNNDEVLVVLDTNNNVVVYDFDNEIESSYTVLYNVSNLVNFLYDEDNDLAQIQATHNVTTAIIDYIYLDKPGNLIYHSHDASMISGTFHNYSTITNSDTINVVTGITQASNGQVTYQYDVLNTTHSTNEPVFHATEPIGSSGMNVITHVYLSEDGDLSYAYTRLRVDQAAQALTLTYLHGKQINPPNSYSVIWMYKDPANENQVTFSYANLATDKGEKITPISSRESNATLQYGTSYRVLTNIMQYGDGKISYTYSDINTIHSSSGEYVAVPNATVEKTKYVITDVCLSKDGELSYVYSNMSTTSFDHTGPVEKIITNDGSYEVISNIRQLSNGKISYETITLNTRFTYQGDNGSGPVFNLSIDKNGKISYVHKAIPSFDGVNSGAKKLHNGPTTYQVINNISQNDDGQISYSYITLSTSFDNYPTGSGILKNVHIDDTGKLSYHYESIAVNEGIYNDRKTSKGVKVERSLRLSYNFVITNISQDEYGQISYSYVGLYTDPVNDYKYHELTVLINENPSVPSTNTVNVLNSISTTNGNATSHTISATKVTVPTKVYVDNLLTAKDALHYVGLLSASSTVGGPVSVTLGNYQNTDPLTYSIGAVYKVSQAGYFGTEYVTPGDLVISHDDNNTILANNLNYSINSFSGWDIVNNNLNLETIFNGDNTKLGSSVLTAVNLTDHGTLSYASYSLSVTNEGERVIISTANNNDMAPAEGLSTDIIRTFVHEQSEIKGFKVITNVELTQNEYDTKLSYTYGFIYADKNHHETSVNYQPMISSYVIGAVSLTSDGKLSYSYVDIAKSAYHYDVPLAVATYDYNNSFHMLNNKIRAITNLVRDEHGHVISYTYADCTDEHVKLKTISNDGEYWIGGFRIDDPNVVMGDAFEMAYMSSQMPSLEIDGRGAITFNINSNRTRIKSTVINFDNNNVTTTLPSSNKMYFNNLKSLWGTITVGGGAGR